MPINANNKLFGARVRVWRDRLGVSQEKLAELAGLHRTYISDVERGARNISLSSITRLAAALNIPAATLLLEAGQALPGKLADILLVEDDPDNVKLTVAALRSANVLNRIHVEQDGAAALNYLAAMGDAAPGQPDVRPHLILLDLGLPGMDGIEVLRQLKSDPRTRMIPVAVLTKSDRSKEIAACKRLGAGGYVVKPVNIQNLCVITPQLSMQWALLTMDQD